MQCDHIGLFLKDFGYKFLTIIAQITHDNSTNICATFLVIFKNGILRKTAVATLWGNFWKISVTFLLSSGHTS